MKGRTRELPAHLPAVSLTKLQKNKLKEVQTKNARVDELLEAGLKETDQSKRIPIYHEIQQIISDEVPYMFVYFYNDVSAVPANLKNFKPNPTQANNTWNIWEWEIEN